MLYNQAVVQWMITAFCNFTSVKMLYSMEQNMPNIILFTTEIKGLTEVSVISVIIMLARFLNINFMWNYVQISCELEFSLLSVNC